MTALILAAGSGSRLRPFTDTMPKCLLHVGGRPLLQRTLESLAGTGVHRAIIVAGYRHEQVRTFVATLALPFPVICLLNERYASTANTYSLWIAAPECAGQEILILDSDILFHRGIITRLADAPHENVMALREDAQTGDEEIKIVCAADGRILRVGKDIDARAARGESIGIERFSSRAASRLFGILAERRELDEFYEASFQELIDQGTPVHAVSCGSFPCIEIDTPDDLRAAQLLAEGMAP